FGWAAADPLNSEVLYATEPRLDESRLGSGAERFWKSTDHGKNWSVASSAPITGTGVRLVSVSPTTSGIVYAVTRGICGYDYNNCCGNCAGLVLRSNNGGASWQMINVTLRPSLLPGYSGYYLPFEAIAVDPTNSAHVFVGGESIGQP